MSYNITDIFIYQVCVCVFNQSYSTGCKTILQRGSFSFTLAFCRIIYFITQSLKCSYNNNFQVREHRQYR